MHRVLLDGGIYAQENDAQALMAPRVQYSLIKPSPHLCVSFGGIASCGNISVNVKMLTRV